MSLSVLNSNDVKIYGLTGVKGAKGSQASGSKSKAKGADVEGESVDFIQGFDFPTACSKVVGTPDSAHIIAAGLYKPTLKIFDTKQLSLKVLRGIESEIRDFLLLGDDYKKVVMACADRNIELHAQYGRHFKTRVPKAPRCLAYAPFCAELIIGLSSPEIVRLRLDEGRFAAPLDSQTSGVSKLLVSQELELLFAAQDGGHLGLFDLRAKRGLRSLAADPGADLTALAPGRNAYEVFVGSSEGKVPLFDLRMDKPLCLVTHPLELPIKELAYHAAGGRLLSADSRQLRLTTLDPSPSPFCVFESKADINSFSIFGDSGLVLLAQEAPQIGAIFIPALAPAPSFCEFIEAQTEELEEDSSPAEKDETRFVTIEELRQMNALSLIGTKKVKAHLHGFLIATALYDRLREGTPAFSYEDYRKKKVQEALDAKLKESIYVKGGKVALSEDKVVNIGKKKVDDKRFAKMETDRDFEVEETHEAYKARNSTGTGKKIRKH